MASRADRPVSAGPRFCQQSNVYAAENACRTGQVYQSATAAQAFVDDLTGRPWFGELFPTVKSIEVTVKARQDGASVGAFHSDGVGQCDMLPQHLNQRLLCHEVAHVLAAAKYNSHAHDPWFAEIYRLLVFHMMGYDAWSELSQSFLDHGVDFGVDLTSGTWIAL